MTKKDCAICGGIGYIPVPNMLDTKMRCKCTLQELYRNKLGSEVFGATTLKSSPFADLIDQNLFVTATRQDFLPHLRFSLIEQGLGFFSRITNDSQMLDAWLAKAKEQSQKDGDAGPGTDFTSLRDLVEDPKLVVFFLGIVSYSNRALPGILLESLRIRGFEGRPTWIINPHAQPFNKGHLCYSPEVEEYVVNNYKKRKIKPSVRTKSIYEGTEGYDPEDETAPGNKVKHKKLDINDLSGHFGM